MSSNVGKLSSRADKVGGDFRKLERAERCAGRGVLKHVVPATPAQLASEQTDAGGMVVISQFCGTRPLPKETVEKLHSSCDVQEQPISARCGLLYKLTEEYVSYKFSTGPLV